jgi:hypothetical protein
MIRNSRAVTLFSTLLLGSSLAWLGCNRASETSAETETPATKAPGTSRAPSTRAARTPAPRNITLAEGTVLNVRTTSAISTKSATTGETFQATLEEPLAESGRVIAPKGARVTGLVANSDPGGRVKGVAHLTVRLTQLELADGRTVDIQTSTITRQARTTKKKDAAKVGIGSAVGAAIGASAGGGKGAAVGAAAGAGAGGGVVVATRGEPAVIPSESVLRFTLRSPVTVGQS